MIAPPGGECATPQDMSHHRDMMADSDADSDEPDCVLAVTQRGSEGEGAEGPSAILEVEEDARPFVRSSEHQVVDKATSRGQARHDWESATSCSETESVARMPRCRRLVLVSREVDEEIPDSYEERVVRIRRTMQNQHRVNVHQRLVRDIVEFFASVRRVGPFDVEVGEVPRALRRVRSF